MTRPLLSVTFAFMRDVAIVSTPADSVTQKLGVPQVALTDRDVFAGIEEADVYAIRMTSSLHTCTLNRPGFKVNVTPVASTAYELPGRRRRRAGEPAGSARSRLAAASCGSALSGHARAAARRHQRPAAGRSAVPVPPLPSSRRCRSFRRCLLDRRSRPIRRSLE